MVNYARDSDDDEPTDGEDEMEDNNEEQDDEDEESNSNNGIVLHAPGDKDLGQVEDNTSNEQNIATSDSLNVTPVQISFFLSLFVNCCSFLCLSLVENRRSVTFISRRYDTK